MKIHKNRLIHASAAVAAVLAFSHPLGAVAEAPKDVSREINNLRSTIVSADVMIVPRGMTFRTRLQEKDLFGSACTYEVSEKKDLDALLDTLANGGVVEAADQQLGYDARIGVFLHTSGGSVVRLITGPDYNNAPPSGAFNRTIAVVAQKGFEADMRLWAAQRKPTRTSYVCDIESK